VSNGGNAELVREGFRAFLRGDFEALREIMDPAVQWLWFEPGEWDCHDREKVLATLRERRREGVITKLDDVVDGGQTVFIEVSGPRLEEWELPDGRACMVVTVRDGRIVRMQDYRSREDALAGAGLAPEPAPEPPRPRADAQPGWDQVSDLVPFAHAADIDASVAFYERLGFEVRETYRPGARLNWAFLQAGHARLMLERADAPIAAREQAVLFYLYSRDLFGLRERLVQAGTVVGEIRDGTPGPRLEMRLEDPDGYVLMIAQIEDEQLSVERSPGT
jgi:ketosteroid isomerase-like protein